MLRLRSCVASRALRLSPRSQRYVHSEAPKGFASLEDFGKHHVTAGLARVSPGIIASGEGSYVTFQDGRKALDFTTGIGVTGLGHAHPKVSGAAAEQCMKIVHAQVSIAFHEPYLRLIEKLIPVMPHPSLDSFFFWNSGSEAVEAAIKIARVGTGRTNIITMQGAYHGRTYGSSALTRSKTVYTAGVGPLMPGVFTTQYPYFHDHWIAPPGVHAAEAERLEHANMLSSRSLHALDVLFAQQCAPKDTAAIIIEPILGEGGYVETPDAFMEGLRERCDKHGIMLIVDEVQCGFARSGSGRWFATSPNPATGSPGVRPDILVIAKGLANGFPLSGVIANKAVTDKLSPGSMGGTYAGNAVSCAAAVAVADAIVQEGILENVEARSRQLFAFLRGLAKDTDIGQHVLDIRGAGLMVGIEFGLGPKHPLVSQFGFTPVNVGKDVHPANLASRITKRCIEKGLLLLTTSAYEVVRFIPALNITEKEMEDGCKIFEESVREVLNEG